MNLKNLCSVVFALILSYTSFGESNELIIPKNVRLPKDTTVREELLTSLRSFLLETPKANKENSFVLNSDLLETSAMLDEMKDIEKNEMLKDDHFYKAYLTNATALSDTDFVIQLSYIGMKDSVADLRASFTISAKKRSGKFYFNSPLKQNTISWKYKRINNTTVFYKDSLNLPNATAYFKMISDYDKKLNAPVQLTEFYCAENFHEVLQLLGIDYKADYNGYRYNVLSAMENDRSLNVNGHLTSGFKQFDPHDLWHERLHKVISTSIINRPVDEGTAYLYGGGSWGFTWADLIKKFKTYIAANPDADWLQLYNESVVFNEEKNAPLNVDFMINALMVQKIEKEKGFPAVISLLTCGKKEKGNENYFAALQKITGIDKEHFNEHVWKLIKAN